ncbi:YDG domain-containing protein [Massilia phyllosphaerae]|uniref:YDG domain-containing protein n=1 Tax=Massilia phyllosphaerae TaxID=3106034 RepID=UPI002B1CD860|nr:YDG domain-containing protein [Massilia sp. SGZ-792]
MHRHASLNRIFRLVWSHVHQTWVVVSETSRGRGKRASRKLLLATAALTAAHLAQAGPTGGQVTAGTGGIDQAGKTTTVTQSSQNLSLVWKSFNTDASETVNFVQPSSSAIAVNRILDTSGTQFFGHLNANGQVYLINPNGVLFGAGSQINVGGLVASTLDVDDNALTGATRRFAGSGTGSIVNRGDINAAQGGYVAFVGNRVSNAGAIAAPAGAVALSAGSDITLSFAGNQLVKMMVTRTTLDNLAENGGLIRADGGAVVLSAGAKDAVLASVVNNTGIIEAHSARAVNGTIVLDGGAASTVSNSGTLDASGKAAGSSGGTVKVLGDAVTLAAHGSIDVSGDVGGGLALVGGNFAGVGSERNASATTVDTGAVIRADAVSAGAGGRVAIWSDGATRFDGRISARGGAAGGNGGSVETSGKHLTVGGSAHVDTLAPHGKAGDWLLDPDDFTIYADGISSGDMKDVDVTTALQSSSLTIKTGAHTTCNAGLACTGHSGNGDIILADGVLVGGSNWTSGTTLTLSAYRNIELQGLANLDAGAGTGSMVLRADNTGTGIGTVSLNNQSNVFGNSTGTVKIYYNPSSYTSPTDYAVLTDVNGDPLIRMPDSSKLSTYMYVNVATVIGNKTYDGNITATITSTSVPRGAPSDATVDTSGATATFADKNVGSGKTVTVTGVTLSGSGASKYELNGLQAGTANITKRDLGLSGIAASNKTYDSTTNVTMTGSAVVSQIAGDVVSVSGSGVGSTFADKNAGTGKAVIVTGYSLAGADAGNYNLVAPTNLTADIAKTSLNVIGVTANSRDYDGTTNAALGGTATVAALGSDVVTVTGTGSATFADKNAGSGKAVTVTGYGLSGADAGNYDVVQPTGLTATINKAALNIGGVSVADKVYDANTSATLTGTAAVTAIAGDDVSVTGSGSAVFVDKNVGVNKAVTVSGYTLGGLDAGNYTLAPSGGLTASIGKADLSLSGIAASNKTYDGTTNVTMTGSASVSALGSDAVTVSGSGIGSTFADKNAGTSKAVTISGYSLAGTDAGNYNLVVPTNLTADIAKANLSVIGVTAGNRAYDGTTNATLDGTAAVAAYGSDVVTVTGTGSATFADKNVGRGKAVTVTGYGLRGLDAGNYDVVQPTGLTATIDKAGLVLSGLSVSDKVYDGSTAATLDGTAAVAAYGSDVVTVTGTGSATFADKNAGSNKTVNVSGYSLAGADSGNYKLLQVGGLSANIGKADLTVAGVFANNKVYDGTTAATLSGTATVTPFGGDAVSLSGTATASFVNKNAGEGKAVTVSGYSLGGADAGNYNLVQPAGLNADIGKADLAVTGITANNKTYDGTTVATLSGNATVGAFGADAVSVAGSGTASFANKNAGSGKLVSVTGYALSGADAGNYDVMQPSGLTATIDKAGLQLSGLSVADKVYDGTSAATLSGSASVTPIRADEVSLSGSGSAIFADKNAGSGKAVNVSGYSLSGADAGNYRLLQVGGLSANIGKADLAVSGVTANNKVYDGTAAATLSGSATVNVIGGDSVTVSGTGTGAFADKNAGTGKTVTVSGLTLSGADAGNYNIVQPAGLNADIGKASLAVTGVTANNKTYDGSTAATLSGNATVAAFGSDAVSVGGSGTASFADKNAGSGKLVSVTGFALSGADAGNYNVVQPSGLTASIDKAGLQLTGLSVGDKAYDGTTAATLSGSASVTPFGADEVSLSGTGSAVFADKNAGRGKAVNVSGYSLSGADAGNYKLLQVGGLRADIGKADLALSGVTANNKVYDGSTVATLSGSATVVPISNDAVSISGAGMASFADKNAGSDKLVSVTGFLLTGADAGNYNLVQPAGLNADIGKASLAVSGVSANGKTYDGTTAATLSGVATAAALGNDVVTVGGEGSASFADKNAGSGKLVSVTGYTLSGADAGNYNVVQPAGLSANIDKAVLKVAGVSANGKTYDGSTAATLSGTAAVSAIAGDVVVLNGSGSASFADKNAGSGKAVSVGGYSLSGLDAGNYTLVQPTGLVADIARAVLTVAGVSVNGKTYDGSTAATLSGTAAVSAVAGDAVALSGNASASFADKNVGSGKRVDVGGYTLTGADAGNYSLVQLGGLTASITPASITVSGIGAADKAFDGTTAATVSTAGAVFNGKVGGDVVTVTSTGAFADGAAGLGKIVKLSNVYGGADVGNYAIVDQATAQASITQKPQQIDNAVAQVQSSVLASQASAQPASLNTSSTVLVSRTDGDSPSKDESKGGPGTGVVNTALGFGPGAPKLQIQNGGMNLPPLATSITE